jgi:hypothetical protein
MTYLQDLSSNNFQANLVELSKEKMFQIEAKNKILNHWRNIIFFGNLTFGHFSNKTGSNDTILELVSCRGGRGRQKKAVRQTDTHTHRF